MSWREQAACRAFDPELFFPPPRSGTATYEEAAAKVVCARCPVAGACLAFALDRGESDGIWGGLTPDERRRLHFAGEQCIASQGPIRG